MSLKLKRGGRPVAALIALVTAAFGGLATSAPAAADEGSVTFVGRGYGHGRGMGQFGALGYAVDGGWGYQQILAHYYGGTALSGDAGNPTITVELSRMTGRDTIVAGNGLAVNGVTVNAGGAGGVLVRGIGGGNFQVFTGAGCGGPWQLWNGSVRTGMVITTTGSQADLGYLPVVCEPYKTTGYRGSIEVVEAAGQQYALNLVGVEDYLRGVVPREMPASWGSSPRGMEALKAQAVAARSYLLGSAPRKESNASTCDTESCQVYGGVFETPYDTGKFKNLEVDSTNAAVQQTGGQVMRFAGGAVARTEFSSSTGGWTAGGTFPAVADDGDATASNANRNWAKAVPLPEVAAALSTGPIRTIAVTRRNGLGADGGRALTVVVTQANGVTTSFTGDQIRLKLGLKSTWFTISGRSPAAAQAVVQALYQDVLGRAPDAQGLANWTAVVLTTNNPRLVADGIVNSKERLSALVAAEYAPALHRAPEAGGLANWIAYLEAGATVSDLRIGVYSSAESLAVLGGGDTQAWVAGMYAGILGRPAALAETAAWAQVAAASGREAAVAGIARSPEAGTARLVRYYQTFLGRGLDQSGLDSWLPAMSGRGDFTIPGMIGGSEEYWNRSQLRF